MARGIKIILPRNIHQSAIAGLVLSGAIPIFVQPEYDADEGLAYNVTLQAVETGFKSTSRYQSSNDAAPDLSGRM